MMGSSNRHKLPKKEKEQPLTPPLNPSELENPTPMDSKNTPLSIDGSEEDEILKNSDALTLEELARRRSRRLKQLGKYYLNQYWALMEEVRFQYRGYSWNFGKSGFNDEEEEQEHRLSGEGLKFPARNAENGSGFLGNGLNGENQCGISGKSKEDRFEPSGECGDNLRCGFRSETSEDRSGFAVKAREDRFGMQGKSFPVRNGGVLGKKGENRCAFPGCKGKPMALTGYCHPHILSDTRQQLYKGCNFVIKSAQTGPIVCGKPIDRAAVPSLCGNHFQRTQKQIARALKKAGLNISSTSKPPPKFHVIIAEYVRHIQAKRREAKRAKPVENAEKGVSMPVKIKEENVD